ncbi:MAG: type IX secretion system membrane protein PorP/SprF [Flavobacteriaceae bacterium]|nr:type IX secretion system membrane protein PorP/SprF [Flavobacteriaceae bacterium]
MKKIFISIILILLSISAQSQQEPQYTQYMYNPTLVNPAYAGSKGFTSVYGLYRAQWVGIEGAPQTINFTFNKPINASNLGYGFSIINDRIGPSDETQISVDLSYTIFFDNDYRLAFGLKTTGNLINVDYSKLNQYNQGELILQNNIVNRFSPNIGGGFYLYNKTGYFGISIPMLLDTKRYDDLSSSEVNQRNHIYFIGGKVFNLSNNIKFKPAYISKIVSGSPIQLDLSGNFLFNERFTLGAAYRLSASLSAMAGFQINDKLFIGYGYDRETTRLSNFNSGSHEIFLQFDLFENNKKIETPRFF